VVRDGAPQPVDGGLVLGPGDRVYVYAQPPDVPALERIFRGTQH
jgi:hypothetical protein